MSEVEFVAIGKIVKPFGVKGEFRVRSLSDVPGRFQGLTQVTLVAPSGRSLLTNVTRVQRHHGSYVLGVDAWSTPEEAAAFRGGLITIPQEAVSARPAGHYYEFELIGMTVTDQSGRSLGTLEEVLETRSHPVFAVRSQGHETLIPATRDVVTSVDVERRTMTVRPIQGWLDDDAM
jgi:16S rRNA processing protein RimM